MNLIDKFFFGAFVLIAIYLVLKPDSAFGLSQLFDGAAKFNQVTFATLQGRDVVR